MEWTEEKSLKSKFLSDGGDRSRRRRAQQPTVWRDFVEMQITHLITAAKRVRAPDLLNASYHVAGAACTRGDYF